MKKILIVEDDLGMHAIYRDLFEHSGAGYDLIYTTSVEEAIEALNSEEIDLVILDIVMEPISGEYLYLKLREDKKFRGKAIPVIIVSVLKKENLLRLERVGDVSIFEKPIKKEAFLETVGKKLSAGRKKGKA